jgi:hypothetical protein
MTRRRRRGNIVHQAYQNDDAVCSFAGYLIRRPASPWGAQARAAYTAFPDTHELSSTARHMFVVVDVLLLAIAFH